MKCWSCGGEGAKPVAFVEDPTRYVFDLCPACQKKEAFCDSMTEVKSGG